MKLLNAFVFEVFTQLQRIENPRKGLVFDYVVSRQSVSSVDLVKDLLDGQLV